MKVGESMYSKTFNYIIARIYSFCILLFKKAMVFFVILLPTVCFMQSFDEGESLFRSNQPELAIPQFQRSLLDGSAKPSVYNYLGIAYMQTGQTQTALDTFVQGTQVAGSDRRSLYYNAGNAAYVLQSYDKAKEYFSYALVADKAFANAYLNRGNTSVQLTSYQEAIDDYKNYLLLDPNSEQYDEVVRMIASLEGEIAFQLQEKERLAAEQKRLEEEQKRIEEEQLRLAAEKAAAEEARRQRILAEVSASLQAGEATNLSAGSEGGLNYEFEEAELE